jgi:hypothetical protein
MLIRGKDMKNFKLKAWDFGLALFDSDHNEVMSVKEINIDEIYYYVVGENMCEELKRHFLNFLNESKYTPTESNIEYMAKRITAYYIACIDDVTNDLYIDAVVSFNSVIESARWFFDNCVQDLSEYDAEI